jgi:hypothetical protein
VRAQRPADLLQAGGLAGQDDPVQLGVRVAAELAGHQVRGQLHDLAQRAVDELVEVLDGQLQAAVADVEGLPARAQRHRVDHLAQLGGGDPERAAARGPQGQLRAVGQLPEQPERLLVG